VHHRTKLTIIPKPITNHFLHLILKAKQGYKFVFQDYKI
jgi:hypothetical protein